MRQMLGSGTVSMFAPEDQSWSGSAQGKAYDTRLKQLVGCGTTMGDLQLAEKAAGESSMPTGPSRGCFCGGVT